MPNKPKILMIISLFSPVRGGAEQQALQLAAGLQKHALSVAILTRKLSGLPVYEEINGVPVYRNITTVNIGKLFGLVYAVSVFWFLLRHRHSYDIIHCHLAQGLHTPVALVIKFLLKKSVIIKIGATGALSDFSVLRTSLMGHSMVRLLRHADRLVVVCKQAFTEALQNGIPKERIVLIPNSVDCTMFRPLSEQRQQGCITFTGRLDRMKGVDVLIHAFALLKARGAAARLRIIGEGPEQENLKALASSLCLADEVFFYGVRHDIPHLLNEAALFVLPSLSEGLSNAVLEAMACGLPVVATRVGGIPDIITDGVNGLLVPPGQPEQLAEALWHVLNDRALAEKLGANARRTVIEQYCLDNMLTAYQSLYQNVQPT